MILITIHPNLLVRNLPALMQELADGPCTLMECLVIQPVAVGDEDIALGRIQISLSSLIDIVLLQTRNLDSALVKRNERIDDILIDIDLGDNLFGQILDDGHNSRLSTNLRPERLRLVREQVGQTHQQVKMSIPFLVGDQAIERIIKESVDCLNAEEQSWSNLVVKDNTELQIHEVAGTGRLGLLGPNTGD